MMAVYQLLQISSNSMGQENSLNCRNNYKEKELEVQTTQSNALHLARAIQSQNDHSQSNINSKKSATTIINQIQNKPSLRISKAHLKTQQTVIPQHQNLLKVSYSPFEGAQKHGQKWIEKDGICLSEIIQSRYNTNMHFPQAQVVTLVESLVYALAYLQKQGIKHNDFYPTNIYYCAGIFKLVNPINIQCTAYGLTQQRKRFSFLGPQLIADIVEDTPENDIPAQILFKSDIFAIGMIILEFATLQSSAECYDEQNYQLIDSILKERLSKVAQLYSPKIADCIAQMLVYNVEDRIPVLDLALIVYLNSQTEKIQKIVQQAPVKQLPKGNNLPPLPKQNSPILQHQQKSPQINIPNLQPQSIMMPGQGQISSNNIVVPAPNYAYSHIGPNNQSLLSPSSLQNKLRVIQQIHQKPQFQEDSQGQLSSLPSNFGPGNSQIQQLKAPQQQTQKQIINIPPQQQHYQQQFIQQISPQYLQQNQLASPTQIINTSMRQVILSTAYQNQPQFLASYAIQNLPAALPGNFILPAKVTQQNKALVSPFIQNLPQGGFKSTQVQSKYEPIPPKKEEQLNNQPYEGASYQSKNSSFNQKQFHIAQKDHNLFHKQTLKEKVQKQPISNFKTNTYQTTHYQSYKPTNYSTSNYNIQSDYLTTKQFGNKFETKTTANNYQAISHKNKYESTSITNKYARPRDQNGQTLEQRVDRILQISRSIK